MRIENYDPKSRPILFREDMVRALLNTKVGVWPVEPIDPFKPWKWQTRRLMKLQPGDVQMSEMDKTDPVEGWQIPGHSGIWWDDDATGHRWKCPYGIPGDPLWVRETFRLTHLTCDSPYPVYKASDPKVWGAPWKPSIFMPRWASRIDLKIMDVRAHRIREISYGDALAEGIPLASGKWYDDGKPRLTSEIDDYLDVFKEINGPESTEKNQWVWCLEFMRTK